MAQSASRQLEQNACPWGPWFDIFSQKPRIRSRGQKGSKSHTKMAVVFESESAKYQTKFYNVVNGDDSDLRFLDKRSAVPGYINQFVVVGLTAKGNAKNDATGFVVRPTV